MPECMTPALSNNITEEETKTESQDKQALTDIVNHDNTEIKKDFPSEDEKVMFCWF